MIQQIISNSANIACELIAKGYSFLGEGSKRAAYLSPCGGHVIKVPINPIGVYENISEAKQWKVGNKELLARCIITCGFLVIMEYVAPVPVDPNMPAWCKEFDNQVGYNKKGKLVAYDYGC